MGRVDEVSYVQLGCGHHYRYLPGQAEHGPCRIQCAVCGLDSEVLSALRTTPRNLHLRKTGRTTRMMEDILIKCGPEMPWCFIVGATREHAQALRQQLCRIVQVRGLGEFLTEIRTERVVYRGTRIDFEAIRRLAEKRGLPSDPPCFLDHYTHESLPVAGLIVREAGLSAGVAG